MKKKQAWLIRSPMTVEKHTQGKWDDRMVTKWVREWMDDLLPPLPSLNAESNGFAIGRQKLELSGTALTLPISCPNSLNQKPTEMLIPPCPPPLPCPPLISSLPPSSMLSIPNYSSPNKWCLLALCHPLIHRRQPTLFLLPRNQPKTSFSSRIY
jgi:hypothetical protein